MRGSDMRSGELFSYVDLEKRVPEHHPLRLIRRIVNEVLAGLDRDHVARQQAARGASKRAIAASPCCTCSCGW